MNEYCTQALLARLANDIRQTLHHVEGLLELAAEEPLSPAQMQHLSRCRRSADELLRTASDVSELSSPEPLSGTGLRFSVAAAVGEVVDVMSILAGRKGLRLTCSLAPDLPPDVVADRDLIQDNLRRLLDNSIRFTGSGGIHLSVSTGVAAQNSAALLFEVADTGPGMPAEVLAAHCGPELPAVSSGVGLPLVRRRLFDAGGAFTIVESTCSGTTVRISAPVSLTATAAAIQPEEPEVTASKAEGDSARLRLLVVEDSDESFALFDAYVKGQGHRVSRALDGAAGLEMAKTGDYDLILMDVQMPVMDGYSATRAIREWETQCGRERMPILLFSAEDAARQMRQGAIAGCSGYIAKPARKNDVVKALNHFGNPN